MLKIKSVLEWVGMSLATWKEVLIRIILYLLFTITEEMHPFLRIVQPEQYWEHRYPSMPSFVPTPLLYRVTLLSAAVTIVLIYGVYRRYQETIAGSYVITLALPLTGILTNLIKISVGRLRPDFFNRCYGANFLNHLDLSRPCTEEELVVMDGRKSFPSGHSSVSFCAFGFVSLYLAGQLGTFTRKNQGDSSRFLITVLPIGIAIFIAISRTCDYHHHWQDILAGSLLGLTMVYAVYRLYFPSLTNEDCCHTTHYMHPSKTRDSAKSMQLPTSVDSKMISIHDARERPSVRNCTTIPMPPRSRSFNTSGEM